MRSSETYFMNDTLTLNTRSMHVDQEGTMPRCSIYMTLLQFSTGEYHPLAHCPRIDIQDRYELNQMIMLEIAGDNLALLVGTRGGDQLYIFDWKTGRKRLVSNYPNPFSFLKICPFCVRNIGLGRGPTFFLLLYHPKFF